MGMLEGFKLEHQRRVRNFVVYRVAVVKDYLPASRRMLQRGVQSNLTKAVSDTSFKSNPPMGFPS